MAYSFEVRQVPEIKTIATRGTCEHREIGPCLAKMFSRANDAMKCWNLEMKGPPYCMYLDWRERDCDIEAGCPVEGEGPATGDVYISHTPGCNALVTTHVGSYEHLEGAHRACVTWIKEHGRTMVGAPWEVYVTDPGGEPDASKWKTDLYYPIL